jgi:hypothetical protein
LPAVLLSLAKYTNELHLGSELARSYGLKPGVWHKRNGMFEWVDDEDIYKIETTENED